MSTQEEPSMGDRGDSFTELTHALKNSTQMARDTIALSATEVGGRAGEAVRLDKATMLIERAERQLENLRLFVSFQKQQFHPQAEQLEAHLQQQEEQISLVLSSLSATDKRRVIEFVNEKTAEETTASQEEERRRAERERSADERETLAVMSPAHEEQRKREIHPMGPRTGERNGTGGRERATAKASGRGESPSAHASGRQGGASGKVKKNVGGQGKMRDAKSSRVTSDMRQRRATAGASTESASEAKRRARKSSPSSHRSAVGVRPSLPDPSVKKNSGASLDPVVPCMAEVSEEEYNQLLQLPNMLQRNLTRDRLNAAVEELQKFLERKYRILGTASSRLQSDAIIRKYNKYKSQETARTKPFFCFLDEDLKGRSHIRLDETGRCILRILARLKRIRKLGVGCYALANARRKV